MTTLATLPRHLLPSLVWHLLPPQLTRGLLWLYLQFQPAHAASVYPALYKRALVVVAGLLFLGDLTSTYVALSAESTPYKVLHDLPITATDRDLRQQWRRISLLYHPDVTAAANSTAATTAARVSAEDRFMAFMSAHETLADPVSRFAYDRFGDAPWMRVAQAPKTPRAVLRGAALGVLQEYVFLLVGWAAWAWMGWGRWSTYWRIYMGVVSLAIEVFIVTRPYNALDTLLSQLFPQAVSHAPYRFAVRPLLQFQQRAFLHKLVFSGSHVLGHVGAVMEPPASGGGEELLGRVGALAERVERGAGMVLRTEGMPFQEGAGAALRERLEEEVAAWRRTGPGGDVVL
ncbi:hypothetical protein EV426DRAFT_381727 [Tirmania nivea]|nr:hypothetical protein EV426DRAFT_381727 [Tirmania nivea]